MSYLDSIVLFSNWEIKYSNFSNKSHKLLLSSDIGHCLIEKIFFAKENFMRLWHIQRLFAMWILMPKILLFRPLVLWKTILKFSLYMTERWWIYLIKWNIKQIFLDDIIMFFGIWYVTASHFEIFIIFF